MSFVYYNCLLFMLFFIVFLLFENNFKSPKKIKILIFFGLSTLLLRYLSLILLCLLKDIEVIYKFRAFVYLDYLSIVVLAISLLYIYLRFNKLSFNKFYIISLILFIIYFLGIKYLDLGVSLSKSFGYIINIKGEEIVNGVSLIILGIIFLSLLFFIDKPNILKREVLFLILTMIIMIIEIALMVFKIKIFPYLILSEGIFLLNVYKGINNFKKT
ncbi:MAG: hypothetical protein ACRDCB_01370 [Clostridium sp.]